MKKLLFVFLILFLQTAAYSLTIVGGVISSNTTWDLAGSPYIVSGTNISVNSGVTLIIDPGVIVQFDTLMAMQISGTLRAIGTATQPITFTSNGSLVPGYWAYILFNNNSAPYNFSSGTGSIMKYCIVEYGGGTNVANNAAIRLDNIAPYFNNCLVRNNLVAGLLGFNYTQNLAIDSSSFINQVGYGIDIGSGNGKINVNHCNISYNDSTGIRTNNMHLAMQYSLCNSNGGNGINGIKTGTGIQRDSVIFSKLETNSSVTGGIYYNYDLGPINKIYYLYRDTISANSGPGINFSFSSAISSTSLNSNTITINNCLIINNSGQGVNLSSFSSSFSSIPSSLNSNTIRINNNTISGNLGQGINFLASSTHSGASLNSNIITINNNDISGNASEGINFISSCSNGFYQISLNSNIILINNNTISGNLSLGINFSSEGNNSNILISNIVTLDNNIITGNSGMGINFSSVGADPNLSLNTIEIHNNTISANLNQGINFYCSGGVQSYLNSNTVIIDFNAISGNIGKGINFSSFNSSSAANLTSNNVAINNNMISGNSGQGINFESSCFSASYTYLDASMRLNTFAINDNTISGNLGQGVNFSANNTSSFSPLSHLNSNAITINHNTFSENLSDGINFSSVTSSAPISSQLDSNGIRINSNFIVENSGRGINFSSSITHNNASLNFNNFRINNNTISKNSNQGIYIASANSNSDSVTINDNTISENLSEGIHFSGTYYLISNVLTITNNTVSKNSNRGIQCIGNGFSNVFYGNIIRITANLISKNTGNGLLIIDETSTGLIDSIFVQNNYFVNNIATSNGGGVSIVAEGFFLQLMNNIVAGNITSDAGGGIGLFTESESGYIFSNNTISNNYAAFSSSAITYDGQNLSGQCNTIVNNKTAGLMTHNTAITMLCPQFSNSHFQHSNIFNSFCSLPFSEVYFEGFNGDSLLAMNNYWQRFLPVSIDSVIRDFNDNPTLGLVKYQPFEVTPDTCAPVTPVKNVTKTQVGSDILLTWTANAEMDVAGYKVYWGSPTGYSFSSSLDVGNVTNYTISGLSATDTIEVTAYDNEADGINDQLEGHESWFNGDGPNSFVPISLSSNLTSICPGQGVTFTAHGASTYQFFRNNVSLGVASAANTYYTTALSDGDTIKVIGTNSCASVASAGIIIAVNPVPIINAGTDQTICAGESVIIGSISVPGSTYVWSPTTGLSSSVVSHPMATPFSTTSYIVTRTIISGGCSNKDTISITVNAVPTVTLNSYSSLCMNASSLALSGGSPFGGSYSGIGVTGGTFDPSIAGTGVHTITYTFTDSNSCVKQAISSMIVNALPTINGTSATICSGSSAILTANGAVSYSWMPGALSGDSITISPASSAIYTITGTDGNGCVNTDTSQVVVNNLPIVTGTNSTICSGSSTTLTANGAVSYSWMPGTLSGGSITVSPSSPLTYTVTGTDGNGCSNSDTSQVIVNNLPTVAGTNTTICSGSSATLIANGATSYSWMPGTLTGDSITVSLGSPVTYTITGTDGNGCSGTGTAQVAVNDLPGVNLNSFSALCESASPFILSGGSPLGGVYSGIGVSGGTFDPSSAGPGTHPITYAYADANACLDSATQNIDIDATVAVSFSSIPEFCNYTSPFVLTGGSPSGGSFSGAGVSGGIFDPSISGSGTFVITYTYSTGVCTDSASQPVVVHPTPIVSLGTLPETCINAEIITLNEGTPPGGTYGGNGITGTNNFSPSLAGVGSTDIFYTYTDSFGCSGFDSATIVVDDHLPLAQIIGSHDVCLGDSIQLIASGGDSYIWNSGSTSQSVFVKPIVPEIFSVTASTECGSSQANFDVTVHALPIANAGDDQTICLGTETTLSGRGGVGYFWSPSANLSSPNGQTVSVMPAADTDYFLEVSDANGCDGKDTVHVALKSLPSAQFISDSTNGSMPFGVQFINHSTGASDYLWLFGDGDSSRLTHPYHTYLELGTFTVSLVATAPDGCSDTTKFQFINVDNNTAIVIPNIFSPNSDGRNDLFKVDSKGFSSLTGKFFNRWGLVVAETDLINHGWDGRSTNGDEVSSGTYYYILTGTGNDGKPYLYRGFVEVFR